MVAACKGDLIVTRLGKRPVKASGSDDPDADLSALARYVALPRGVLEQRESLEQLRAIEAVMRIDATVIRTEPLGVDTLADLERAKVLLAARPA